VVSWLIQKLADVDSFKRDWAF